MISNQDLNEIGRLIDRKLAAFKQSDMGFRNRRIVDTATDKKSATPKGSTTATFLPLTGGTMTGGLTMQDGSSFGSGGAKIGGTKVGFYGTSPIVKQTVTGSKAANAALTSLMSALSALGIVTDSTT